ncbi:hypothetical protein [Massilia sp. BJB1822]|uniref:hypothetical protein n=1 Tax=Massilia sp. BJB1822 TaxID=2744470 RepID=UPI001E3B6E8F|nr:hypothetical protein [Massilia sp. BJB1822]
MQKQRHLIPFACLALALPVAAAHAQTAKDSAEPALASPADTSVAAEAAVAPAPAPASALPSWTFGGFGSLGAVRSSEKQADFTANPLNPGQAGHSHEWSTAVDSRFGVQLGAQFDRNWSAVVQVVSERRLLDSWQPKVEWANIKYQATPDLSLRIGRIALPLFVTADYRKAGYALPWVRPPVELYGTLPISSSDGIDASYRWQLGGIKNVTQLLYGRTEIDVSRAFRAKASDLTGISNTASIGALSVRASLLSADLRINYGKEFFNAFRHFGRYGERLANRYDASERRVSMVSLGFNYDPGDWFLMGEAGRINTRSFLGDKTAMYLSGGYRIGAFTPYLVAGKVHANTPTRVRGIPMRGLRPQAAERARRLNGGLNAWLSMISVQDTVAAGLRWDVAPSVALKMQYDRVRPHGGTSGTLINVQPGFRSGQAFGVSSVVVDFVF